MTPAPVFLVGSVRSGTTLLRLMLDHHPRIAFFSEFEFVVDCMPPAGGLPSVDDFRRFVATHRIFHMSGFQVRDGLSYAQLADDFLVQKKARDGKPIVGATVHEHFDRVLRIWPDARFIHLVRDPRDCARSVVEMGWAGNAYSGTHRWIDAEKLWDQLAPTLAPGRYIETTHEDLIRQPVQTLTALARFMGDDYHPDMLSYPNDSTYGPPTPSLVEQWKKKMPEMDVRLVEARVGDLLTRRGYQPSGFPPITITPEMEARFAADDRAGRRRFRQNRYGMALWWADALTRNLRLGPLHRMVKRKLNAIDMKHIK